MRMTQVFSTTLLPTLMDKVVVAVHRVANGGEVAQAVLDAERAHDGLGEQVAAHELVGLHAAPVRVDLQGGLAVDLGDLAVAAHLGDDAEVVGLGVGARELVRANGVSV
jgi:hypothetical protein